MEETPVSTPSAKSSRNSPRSVYPPGTPKPPIDPPQRRSSLTFAQLMPDSPLPAIKPTEDPANQKTSPAKTPSRSLSNIGRKRAFVASYLRPVATPGHVAQMQKIFSNAKASLQLDMHYAASPAGSIGSRLPSVERNDYRSAVEGPQEPSQVAVSKDWRYSTLPFHFSSNDQDVREPLPEESPLLSNLSSHEVNQSKVSFAEPISWGFITGIGREHGCSTAVEDNPLLPALSDPGLRKVDPRPRPNLLDSDEGSEDDYALPQKPQATELEGPLTDLRVTKNVVPPQDKDEDMKDSPFSFNPERQSEDVATNLHLSTSLDRRIFLSTPAKAAAESAKAKRGLVKDALGSMSNKENAEAETEASVSSSQHSGASMTCPNPAVHHGLPAALCPNPLLHYSDNTPARRGPRNMQMLTPPFAMRSCRSPSPLRASLQPPPPLYHRANTAGSPMPVLRSQPSLGTRGLSTYHPRLSYFPPPGQEHHRPTHAARRRSHRSDLASPVSDHFEPGWYYAAKSPELRDKPAYAFSTAAARVEGSSRAPESRILDSYRTDTLTPLARPTTRFKKNGIGAVASAARGVSKYYGTATHSADFHAGVRPQSRGINPGMRKTPEHAMFMSSPPRAMTGWDHRSDMAKRRRTKSVRKAEFEIVEDETAEVRSKVASLLENEEPIEVDEDIQAAVRMSIAQSLRENRSVEVTEETGVKELSPNVTPFRKRSGPRRKRRPSYWDSDLEEIQTSPARKEVRAMREQVLFDKDDLSGEVRRAGEVLAARLSSVAGVNTASREIGEVEMLLG